jgi:hypothetical protein
MLRELTEHIQTIYFACRWRVITVVLQEITESSMKLDILEGNALADGDPPTPGLATVRSVVIYDHLRGLPLTQLACWNAGQRSAVRGIIERRCEAKMWPAESDYQAGVTSRSSVKPGLTGPLPYQGSAEHDHAFVYLT